MSTFRIKRGTTDKIASYVGPSGELLMDTDKDMLVLQTGSRGVYIATTNLATVYEAGLMAASDKEKLDSFTPASFATKTVATQSENGLMSAADKTKLDNLDLSDYATTDVATAGKNGLMSAADKAKLDTVTPSEYATKTTATTLANGLMSAADKAKLDTLSLDSFAPNTLVTTSNAGLMSSADKIKLDNIDTSTFATKDTATTTTAGLMSAADKSKLDGLSLSNTATSSSNGFMSSTDKAKLDSIDTSAYASKATATESSDGLMSAADKAKLDSINPDAAVDVRINPALSSGVNLGSVSVNGTAYSFYAPDYQAGTGLTKTSNTFALALSGVTAGDAGPDASATVNTFPVPRITVDAYGRVTALEEYSITVPSTQGGGGESYILPAATASVLGGVKIGSNISVSDGTISLTSGNISNALGYTPANAGDIPAQYELPEATNAQLGGIRVGDNLSIENGVLSLSAYDVENALGYTPANANDSYELPQATSTTLGGIRVGNNLTISNGVLSLTSSDVAQALGYTPSNTDTTYSAGSGLSLTDTTFSLATVGASSTAGPTTNQSPSHGGTFNVPYVSVDTYGRVIGLATRTITLPQDYNTDTHYLAYMYAGSSTSTTQHASSTNPYLNLVENVDGTNTLRSSVRFVGAGSVSIASANGTITITGTASSYSAGTGLYLSGTEFSLSTLHSGFTAGPTSNATLSYNGSFTVPKVVFDAYGRATSYTNVTFTMPSASTYSLPNATASTLGGVKIGSNISVSNGTISLTSTNVTNALGYTPPTADTNTHWSAYLYAGASGGTAHSALANPYLTLRDGGTTRTNIQLKAAGNMTISASAGVVTFSAGAATYTLPNATASVLGGVKIGSNITVNTGTISLTSANVISALGYTPPSTDTNTHYSANLIVGATSAATATAASTTNASTFLILRENATNRNALKISGAGGVAVSTANGAITISGGIASYTLPQATSTTLGGVKVSGGGLVVSAGRVYMSSITTAATYGSGAAATLTHGGTLAVPWYTRNAMGQVTAGGTRTYTLPAATVTPWAPSVGSSIASTGTKSGSLTYKTVTAPANGWYAIRCKIACRIDNTTTGMMQNSVPNYTLYNSAAYTPTTNDPSAGVIMPVHSGNSVKLWWYTSATAVTTGSDAFLMKFHSSLA